MAEEKKVQDQATGEEKKAADAQSSGEPKEEVKAEAEVKEEAKADSAQGSNEPKEEKAEVKEAETNPPAGGEEPAEEKEEEFEVPKEFKDMVEKIEAMTILELNELVKVLEKKFGVSASAMVVAGGGAGEAGGGAEEKDEFNVELTAVGDQKVQVIKAIKDALGLGLKEAKDMTDGAPVMLKEGVKKEEAEEIKKKIEEAGGKVDLK